MTKKSKHVALVLALLLPAGRALAQEGATQAVVAATDAVSGEQLFMTKTCFTCHGKDAKTPILPNFPKIAGQNAAYALQQMHDIKDGVRTNGMTAAMRAIMHLVNDEEMKVLAEYVSKLQP